MDSFATAYFVVSFKDSDLFSRVKPQFLELHRQLDREGICTRYVDSKAEVPENARLAGVVTDVAVNGPRIEGVPTFYVGSAALLYSERMAVRAREAVENIGHTFEISNYSVPPRPRRIPRLFAEPRRRADRDVGVQPIL